MWFSEKWTGMFTFFLTNHMKEEFTDIQDYELKKLKPSKKIIEFNVCCIETTIHRTTIPKFKILNSKHINDFVRKIDLMERNIETKEISIGVYLNRRNAVIAYDILSIGGLHGTVIDAKILFNNAISLLASNIIIVHNHPSGQCFPSESDKTITLNISKMAKLMDMNLLDSVIITQGGYFSFADDGLLF